MEKNLKQGHSNRETEINGSNDDLQAQKKQCL